jgi:hypothetical protein
MSKKVKTLHALNWFYGNICTRKCYSESEKQKKCYDRMSEIIAGHEDFMITHKLFIWAMRKKHKVCSLNEAEFRKRNKIFGQSHCKLCEFLNIH